MSVTACFHFVGFMVGQRSVIVPSRPAETASFPTLAHRCRCDCAKNRSGNGRKIGLTSDKFLAVIATREAI